MGRCLGLAPGVVPPQRRVAEQSKVGIVTDKERWDDLDPLADRYRERFGDDPEFQGLRGQFGERNLQHDFPIRVGIPDHVDLSI